MLHHFVQFYLHNVRWSQVIPMLVDWPKEGEEGAVLPVDLFDELVVVYG